MRFKLIIKKINNNLTKEESNLFDSWLNESTKHLAYFNLVKSNFNAEVKDINKKKAWRNIQNSIPKRKSKLKSISRFMAAAVIIGCLFTTYYFSNQKYSKSILEESFQITEIAIGSDKATLTLENGSNVLLNEENTYRSNKVTSNGKSLVYNESKLTKEKLSYNYLTIPRGGQFFVQLSDGTKVWLNSESKLKYPVNFIKGDPREIELVYGEAYLEVSKSEKHNGDAFVLKTNEQSIKVLGTMFNVKAYKDDTDILTTLVEGSVSVSNNINKNMLKPGEQSRLSQAKNEFEITTVDVNDIISWREGEFSFTNRPLQDIMKVLSRWYDIDIIIVNEDLKSIRFTGLLSKQQHIENILEIIKNTNNLNYKIYENKIIIE